MAETGMFTLEGRTALVTGGGQGVGRAAALALARCGAAVAVNDFHLERAEAVAAEIAADGGRSIGVQADVSDYGGVRRMIEDVASRLSPLDILVNNAGNAGPDPVPADLKPFWETDPADWQPWFSTNLYGVLNCCHAAMPGMIARNWGRIVSVVSDAGRVGEPHYAVYSGAKAGAAGFMRAIAKAGGRYNITANCVSLSAISTPGLEARLADPERRKKILSNYVIRRLGKPEDAAAMILFLSSPAAEWITGQTYPVNGGYDFAV